MEMNSSNMSTISRSRQVCWRLPSKLDPSIESLENQFLHFLSILPDFIQTILLAYIDDRDIVINTVWFASICTVCCFFGLLFLSMGAQRLKEGKSERAIRARCQQLQQHNHQLELERATFERQNQKLSNEIDELKTTLVPDTGEDIYELREEIARYRTDVKLAVVERDALMQDLTVKQNLLRKHEFDMQRQADIVTQLNDEILRLQDELTAEHAMTVRLQSNDLSIEHLEKCRQMIDALNTEIIQLKEEQRTHLDRIQSMQDQMNQTNIEKNQLTLRIKQSRDAIEQRQQWIDRVRQEVDRNTSEDLRAILVESNSFDDQDRCSTMDDEIEKSGRYLRDLQDEIDRKAHRVKELDLCLTQERDRAKEIETKLKVVLELRERDTHLHLRQLGETDSELRRARTDTERVRILQTQLEMKQQQLNDMQETLTVEQGRFTAQCSKLEHDTHEKWMEVKRLTRELDVSRRECEGLRKQISKFTSHDRTMAQRLDKSGRTSNELEMTGSPSLSLSFSQGDKFTPIDHAGNDSRTASPADVSIERAYRFLWVLETIVLRKGPPLFAVTRPPFFRPPFLPVPPPLNPLLMHSRFLLPMPGSRGILTPMLNNQHDTTRLGSPSAAANTSSNTHDESVLSLTNDPESPAKLRAKKLKKSFQKKTKAPTTSVLQETV